MSLALSFHEAGHAVCAIKRGLAFTRATIVATADAAGHVQWSPGAVREAETLDTIIIVLAGPAAEQRYTGRRSSRDRGDLETAAALARLLDPATPAADTIARCRLLAEADIALHWSWIQRAAATLFRLGTLTARQIQELRPSHGERG